MSPLSLIAGAKPALIAGGAALILGSSFGFYIGNKLGDAKVDRIINKTLIRNVRVMQKADVITEGVGTKTAAAEVQIRTVTRTIQEKVPVYVPLKSSCDVPAGFVRVFNASAQGVELPDSPPEPADTATGITLAAVADVTAENFGICRSDQARLKGWQDWYAQMKTAYDKAK